MENIKYLTKNLKMPLSVNCKAISAMCKLKHGKCGQNVKNFSKIYVKKYMSKYT